MCISSFFFWSDTRESSATIKVCAKFFFQERKYSMCNYSDAKYVGKVRSVYFVFFNKFTITKENRKVQKLKNEKHVVITRFHFFHICNMPSMTIIFMQGKNISNFDSLISWFLLGWIIASQDWIWRFERSQKSWKCDLNRRKNKC